MLDALHITRLHDEATLSWHLSEPPTGQFHNSESLAEISVENHRANFDLWHEEDKAREPEASDSQIAAIKHSIDKLNQTRNDLVEKMDRLLLTAAGEQNPLAPLHSETPGLILDRLSILALKIYHTEEETRRASATEAHRQKNALRLACAPGGATQLTQPARLDTLLETRILTR